MATSDYRQLHLPKLPFTSDLKHVNITLAALNWTQPPTMHYQLPTLNITESSSSVI